VIYTLYGHEGSSNSAHFSPCGDYFTSAGNDSIVMVWKSNLADVDQEVIEDLGAAIQVPTGGAKAPGGISTNRKEKVAAASNNQQRYQNIASTSQPYNSNQPPSH
jgi:WD40 repeat protein